MSIFKSFVSQTRKPQGFLGKLMLGGMNGAGHAKLADWGMARLEGLDPLSIAELGCGGGRNAAELLKKYPRSRLTAIDYSALSVEKTEAYNNEAVKEGRCEVKQGDVSKLDLPDGSYDLATAFETVYFWPGPDKSFAEVFRILNKGGTFLIVNESNGEDETGKKYESIIDGMKCYTAEELTAALDHVGFSTVAVCHHSEKPWLAVVAKK